ncbi:hypothetical protein PG993_003037 [Apiospora rasikravindrae]|uniref:Uncharacterized protein n=1 Tax=Apiospora rasikravindrae TaxID=990691 RepID=A0ABR1TYT4_9PEZI
MDIQPPPDVNASNLSYKTQSLVESLSFPNSSISNFPQNKLWSCDLLMQYAPNCAFVGCRVVGLDGELPSQIGLVYLPKLSTAGSTTTLNGGVRRVAGRLDGCQVTTLSIRKRQDGGEEKPSTRPCYFGQNFRVDASDVEPRLVDLLTQWKAESGNKFLVLMGFNLARDMYKLLSRWPAPLDCFDGWVDSRDLAVEKVKVRGLDNYHLDKTPSLRTYMVGLCQYDDRRAKKNAPVATDAMRALMLLLVVWNACRENTTPSFHTTDYLAPKREKGKREKKREKVAKKEAKAAFKQASLQEEASGSEPVEVYSTGSLFGSTLEDNSYRLTSCSEDTEHEY